MWSIRKMLVVVALVAAVAIAFASSASAEQASASHILVSTEEEALRIKEEIANGADFGEMAKKHSSCPSKNKGGSLGNFGRGAMVGEFDAAVFSEETEIGAVIGPIKTQFGFHLILVTQRDE